MSRPKKDNPERIRGTVVRGYITRYFKEEEWEENLIETEDTDDGDAIPHYVLDDSTGKYVEWYAHNLPHSHKLYVVDEEMNEKKDDIKEGTVGFNLNEYNPDYTVPPSETIKELMNQHGITRENLAARLISSVTLVDYLLNDIAVLHENESLCQQLADVFTTSKQFWINLSKNYEDHKPAKETIHIDSVESIESISPEDKSKDDADFAAKNREVAYNLQVKILAIKLYTKAAGNTKFIEGWDADNKKRIAEGAIEAARIMIDALKEARL